MSERIVIVPGCRTAVGKLGGALKDLEATDLGGIVIKEAVKRSGLKPEDTGEVVYRCMGQATENAFTARLVLVRAGISYEAAALTVNRLCPSGLQAIVTATQEIESGMCEIAVVGGCEGMTNIPFYLRKTRYRYRMGYGELEDGLTTALPGPFTRSHMGTIVENIANQYNVTRQEQDRWVAISQQRASRAQEERRFDSGIVPIEVEVSKKETMIFDKDEHVRPGTVVESLAKLRPAFEDDGSVTAGNATGINSVATAAVLMKESRANALGLEPLVRLVDVVAAGMDPSTMGTGSVPAFRKLLKKAEIRREEIGLTELSEAFAAQAVACMKELELDENIVNVNGSRTSLGHPIGATGCIITIKLTNEMIRRKVRYGVSTLCIGGGQGLTVLSELCS